MYPTHEKSLYFPTAFRGTGPTPQVRQFDGVHLVALRSRLELHDCIPLLSEFQFFFALPLRRRRIALIHFPFIFRRRSCFHRVGEFHVMPVRCRLKRAKLNLRLKSRLKCTP